jgi:hypothetical protein
MSKPETKRPPMWRPYYLDFCQLTPASRRKSVVCSGTSYLSFVDIERIDVI